MLSFEGSPQYTEPMFIFAFGGDVKGLIVVGATAVALALVFVLGKRLCR